MKTSVAPLSSSRLAFLYRSRRGDFKTGCLIATGIFLLIIIGAAIWIAVSWKGWVAGWTRSATTAIINDTQLPADQKQVVINKVNEVAKDFEDGKITGQQLAAIGKAIGESPLLPVGVVAGLEEAHIKPSTLPKEEKEAGILALQRAARGVAEKSIDPSAIRDIIAPINEASGSPNQVRIKQHITDEELRKLFKNAKDRADNAKVPNEPYKINVGEELTKAIDTALGRTPAIAPKPSDGTPPPVPPPAPEKK